jgi:hypothetical protein
MHDDFSDLSTYDGQADPKDAFAPYLSSLPDGAYNFCFEKSELTLNKNNERVLNCTLRIVGGAAVLHTWHIKSLNGMNRLLADLCALGFDAERWGRPGGPSLKDALPNAVRQLVGKRFHGVKATRPDRDDPKKTYTDLHISAPASGSPMPRANGLASAATGPTPNDIPF